MGADAFNDVFGLFGHEARGERHRRNCYPGEAVGAVAEATGEMHMAGADSGVVVMAEAVFLNAAAVVDAVKEVGIAQQRQGAEKGGTVDGG